MTRPILAIGPLTNLQDARSSAAVGFGMISFSLERGQMRMLGSNLIWNIASWLSGPEIIIELNAASLPELENMGTTEQVGGILFPIEEVRSLENIERSSLPTARLILRVTSEETDVEAGISLAESLGFEVELLASQQEDVSRFEAYAERVFLHFNHLDASKSFAETNSWTPKGLWLGPEAEEEFGQLDYEAVDDWIEVINDRWEEE